MEEELPGASGPSDLVIICDRYEHGDPVRSAYIWEIKAPQEVVFSRCNSNRIRPSAALNKAENQLFDYWNDCTTSQFRDAYAISSLDEIHLGGIVIGQRSTRLKCNYSEIRRNALYKKAMGLRKKLVYKPNDIRLYLWDDINDFIKDA